MEDKLGKYFANESSEAECQEILEWRAASEENARLFFRYKSIWANSATFTPRKQASDLISGERVRSIYPNQWLKYAASIALVIGAAVTLFFLFAETGPELTRVVELEDGSEVTLYRDAQLTEIENSPGKQVVSLTGRAYFNVKPDDSRNFMILTDEARIEVVGTSFIVDCLENDMTEVVVESGEVSFSQNPNTFNGKLTPISLKAGEKGLITPSARGLVKQNNRDRNYLAWVNGQLTFDRTEMDDVAKLITEVYGYEVSFENPIIMNCKLTATYKKKSVKQLTKLIAETFGFTYEIEDGRIVFSGAGC